MNIALRGAVISFTVSSWLGLGILGADRCLAQSPPAPAADTTTSHSSAQSEAGEPRAATSADAPTAEDRGPASPADEPHPQARQTKRGEALAKGKPAAVDKLELQTATVTGDREQPKVMYIVPWKKSDIGDLSGKPMNSLLDEALAPIDRDEFKREVMYYQAVRADASQNGAPAKVPAAPPANPR